MPANQPARDPADLARYFVVRTNAGDLEGLVALYEPDAALAGPKGEMLRGSRGDNPTGLGAG
jgi:hypothetical protein